MHVKFAKQFTHALSDLVSRAREQQQFFFEF